MDLHQKYEIYLSHIYLAHASFLSAPPPARLRVGYALVGHGLASTA
jgi:hypothetical protein